MFMWSPHTEDANNNDAGYDGNFWDLCKKLKPFIKGGQSPRQALGRHQVGLSGQPDTAGAHKNGQKFVKTNARVGFARARVAHFSLLVLKKPSDRLFSCLPHLWVGMGIPSPTYIGQLISNPPPNDFWRLISSCWNLSAHFCQLKNHEQSKNHWHSSYCTSSL